MSKCRMIFFLICILFLSIPWPSAGHDVEGTHQTINEKAAKSSTLDQYLKNYLDFYEGIEKSFNDKTVRELLQEGGKEEDNFPRFEVL